MQTIGSQNARARRALPALIGVALALASPAFAQQAPQSAAPSVPAATLAARVPDGRALDELKAGAPPEGAPKAKGVPTGPGSLAGVWYNDKFRSSAKFPPQDLVARTKDGELPPMLPWAAALQQKRFADAVAGHPFAISKSRCLPAGLPISMFSPGFLGLKIIEEPKTVTILIEELNNFRQIRLGGAHPEDVDPSYLGHSIGHWEGDVLVVDTVGFNDDTTLDFEGMPHTDALHVIERFRRISQDRIEVLVTIDDPKTFTHPWQWPRRTLKLGPETDLKEFLCTNQRNSAVGGVTGVTLPGGR